MGSVGPIGEQFSVLSPWWLAWVVQSVWEWHKHIEIVRDGQGLSTWLVAVRLSRLLAISSIRLTQYRLADE